MTTNFEIALKKNELPDYFRGNSQYFTRDPDWGTQLHIINWQGLCGYLKKLENSIEILRNAFSIYLNSVELTKNDACDLLENIGCYYHLRNKYPFLPKDGFDLVRDAADSEKQRISDIMTFLRKTIEAKYDIRDFELYNRRIRKLIDDGGPTNIESL
ncbi:hypothetical protein [Pseudomonas fluorescens]|uniref:Uncharacterized protein n=1 Tax=Pseudomonas fluorescens TaxID=294 RepID=A0A423MKP1_PSEFL|nr:hypothetical protein [Pseudomonas fluorescens]RON85149.1 hypothetical protein BK670_04410 [Pseudomonas fluorescens]